MITHGEAYKTQYGVSIPAKFVESGLEIIISGKELALNGDLVWATFKLSSGSMCSNHVRAAAIVQPLARNEKEKLFLQDIKFFTRKGVINNPVQSQSAVVFEVLPDEAQVKASEDRRAKIKAMMEARRS